MAAQRDVGDKERNERTHTHTHARLPRVTSEWWLLLLLAVYLVVVPCGEGFGMRAFDALDAGATAATSWPQQRDSRLLSLRGGAPEADEGAGMATALLEPSLDAAHRARQALQAVGTRVSFEDFSPSKRDAHPAKRKRHERGGSGHPGEEDPSARAKGGYEKLFEDCYNPDRPGFLESLPDLPEYEPESDELAQDNEV